MMKPIDENTPKDGTLLLWSPFLGGTLGGGRWDDDRYAKNPRPYWSMHCIQTVWGKTRMRDYQPTHWDYMPTSPDQVTIEAPKG